jgi:hypothetical protein
LGEEEGGKDDMYGGGRMTVEIDNTNTRRDETEKSNGMQSKQENRTIVLVLPAMFPSILIIHLYICVPYLVTVFS